MTKIMYDGNLENVRLAKFKLNFTRGETKDVSEEICQYALAAGGFTKILEDDSHEKMYRIDKENQEFIIKTSKKNKRGFKKIEEED